ncbi:PIN domain-containing protein [Candidatus Woesebacteria bacterium]|nr:PIN domain-containing protein [Candidatus Woesebacteria bacterium]
MDSIIIDSSAVISLGTVSDSNYAKAKEISSQIRPDERLVILPGEIFTEIINVVGKKVGHDAANKQAEKLISSKTWVIEETTSAIRKSTIKKFKKQPKSVSFTDCLVMAFADEFATKLIFGFDETFRKNGYLRLGIDKEGLKL